MLEVGTPVIWRFPGSSNEYHCSITEALPVRKKGDEDRYRVKGDSMDCYALGRDLAVK